MKDDAKPHEVFEGIDNMVREIAKKIKSKWICSFYLTQSFNLIIIIMESLEEYKKGVIQQ
jgi:hypothetical protein